MRARCNTMPGLRFDLRVRPWLILGRIESILLRDRLRCFLLVATFFLRRVLSAGTPGITVLMELEAFSLRGVDA